MFIQIKNYKIKKFFKNSGFTLLETLIVVAVTATIATIGIGYYMNASKTKILERATQEIVSLLKYAQQNSVSQKDSEQWGVHFENPVSGNDFYALYKGATYSSPIEIKHLPEGVVFSTPSIGNSLNISFNKLTGTNYSGTNQFLVIQSTSSNATTTISVSSQGLISY
ncbi:MAG: pilus assembly FimT family protein [Minisyncoccia bacterium]